VLPQNKSEGAPNVALSAEAITNFESYPSKVQKLLASALELTTRNLDYKYGSADPANGGMDCSGFVYYVLKQNGVAPYVPADCKDQYTWLRSAGTFEPVVSGKDDSFELNKLQPGDLLFWSGPYSTERDPPITEAMIYLGREKRTGARVMVGASDGRTYQSQQRFGVSVFEFKMPQTENSKAYERQECPRFVGYGHIPFLNEWSRRWSKTISDLLGSRRSRSVASDAETRSALAWFDDIAFARRFWGINDPAPTRLSNSAAIGWGSTSSTELVSDDFPLLHIATPCQAKSMIGWEAKEPRCPLSTFYQPLRIFRRICDHFGCCQVWDLPIKIHMGTNQGTWHLGLSWRIQGESVRFVRDIAGSDYSDY
jgi:peptidoglycan DL-endopeptidase CwlO